MSHIGIKYFAPTSICHYCETSKLTLEEKCLWNSADLQNRSEWFKYVNRINDPIDCLKQCVKHLQCKVLKIHIHPMCLLLKNLSWSCHFLRKFWNQTCKKGTCRFIFWPKRTKPQLNPNLSVSRNKWKILRKKYYTFYKNDIYSFGS